MPAHTHKFSRYIIFVVFVVDLLSVKFSSLKFIDCVTSEKQVQVLNEKGNWNDHCLRITVLLITLPYANASNSIIC